MGVHDWRSIAGWVRVCLGAVLACTLPLDGSVAQTEKPKPASSKKSKTEERAAFIRDICLRIEAAAKERNLPPAFFARLIWQESRFNPRAVSPKGASGIAQFMPGTAKDRGLEDPFDPRSALPASAHYLSDLRDEFGNVGLAAAAYNAGPNRVARWRAGKSRLPAETQNFVAIITGYSATDWNAAKLPKADFSLDKKRSFQEACRALPVRRFKPQTRYASAPWQPWGVHLTAAWSPTKAMSFYAQIQRRHPKVLGNLQPMLLRQVNPGMGARPRFEVRIGKPNRGEANKFCQRLRRAGGLCLVYKTRRR